MRFEAQASGDASAIRAETIAPRARAHLASAIEHHPQRAFALFCALHALVWTALPSVLYANLPLDLIEALTYGREWQIGYDKLPPLPWWMVEAVHRSIGIDAAYYALAQLAVIGAFALVWWTARPLVGELGALVAILIIDGLLYFHYTAAKFNHDVIQLPLWALKSAKKAKVRCGWCSIADASLAARGVIVPARLTDGSQFACASNRIELLGCR